MQSLAVKYRPKTFEDCIGQKSIIKILSRQIELNQFKHAYLFCGSSGCGKTTCARVFTKMINKREDSAIEIDAASNSGVDNVRELVKQASERSLVSKYKIFIIDECHALSNAAWQAFLKCIEETPEYTIFIFCTTDPQKIPATIINRCMRFNFTRLSSDLIKERLDYICRNEGLQNYHQVTDYISKISKGQMRDAIANLEQVIAFDSNLNIEKALKALNIVDYSTYIKLTNNLIDDNEIDIITIIQQLYDGGIDIKLFIDNYITFILESLKYVFFKDISVTQIPNDYKDNLDIMVSIDTADKYFSYVLDKLLNLKNILKTDSLPKETTTIVLMQIAKCQ